LVDAAAAAAEGNTEKNEIDNETFYNELYN